MTTPEKPKRAPRKKSAPKDKPIPDRFAGYVRDSNGNLSDPWTSEFQACIREGRRWDGPPAP